MPNQAQSPAVAGARVVVIDPSSMKTVASATTDRDGNFQIGIGPGTYLVQGAGTKQYVRVESGQRVEVNFALANP